MIHSENGLSELKGKPSDLMVDFVAINIALRHLLKRTGFQTEDINKMITDAMFTAAANEDQGETLEHKISIEEDKKGGTEE